MEEVEGWWKLAKDDFKGAKINFDNKQYSICIFLCQQSVEKGLKALQIKKFGEVRKIHDLVELGISVDAPVDLMDKFKELTSAYVYTRYPDVTGTKITKNKAFDFLKINETVIKWLKTNI